jgi:hypothetical protein
MVMQAIANAPEDLRSGCSATAEQIHEALVDHAIPGDRLGYLDRNHLRGRERLSKVGTRIVWQMLATSRGARTERDHDAYQAALRQLRAIEGELTLNREQRRRVRNEAVTSRGSATTLLAAIGGIDEARDDLERRRSEVNERIQGLRHDSASRVPVDDEVPDDEIVDRYSEIEQEILGDARCGPGEEVPPLAVRDPPWITVTELSYVSGISYPQAARWARGESLPHKPGDPRRPFEPDSLPVDESLGPRRKRIAVVGLNPTFLEFGQTSRRLAEVLAVWPKGWSPQQCAFPLNGEIADP